MLATPTPTPQPATASSETEGAEGAEAQPWKTRDFKLPAHIWLSTLHKLVSRHVRLPRSAKSGVAGSQHPRFSIQNSPLELVKLKCEEAGLIYKGSTTKGYSTRTTWKGDGPMTAYNFCQTDRFKQLGVGSAALQTPGKGKTVSDVVTLAIPPITVVHVETLHEWRMEVSMYLGVLHSSKRFTLPINANSLYTTDPTPLFLKMGMKVLKQMYNRNFPLSRAFRLLLGPGYLESEDEESLSDDSPSESGSNGDEQES